MEHKAISIRAFIGAKDFELSRGFYRDLGFQESVITPEMSYFQTQGLGFYLQNFLAPFVVISQRALKVIQRSQSCYLIIALTTGSISFLEPIALRCNPSAVMASISRPGVVYPLI